MAAQIGKIIVNRVQLFLKPSAYLTSCVGGSIGAVCFNQIDHRFCLGQIQLAVQKSPLGKFTPGGGSCACQIQRLQSGSQHGRRAVTLNFHSVLTGIAVRASGIDGHALIDNPLLFVQQSA